LQVERSEHKGIVITRPKGGDMVILIHEDSFLSYLESVPPDENGWRAFRGKELASQKFSGYFTVLIPQNKYKERKRKD
jgi:hypothetical protein